MTLPLRAHFLLSVRCSAVQCTGKHNDLRSNGDLLCQVFALRLSLALSLLRMETLEWIYPTNIIYWWSRLWWSVTIRYWMQQVLSVCRSYVY